MRRLLLTEQRSRLSPSFALHSCPVPFWSPEGCSWSESASPPCDLPVRTCHEETRGRGEVMSVKVGRKAQCGLRQITHQTFLGLLRPGFASCCHAAKHAKRNLGGLPIPSGSGPLNQTQVLRVRGHQTAESFFQRGLSGTSTAETSRSPLRCLSLGRG